MEKIMQSLTREVIRNDTYCELQITKRNNNLTIELTHFHFRYNYNNASIRIQSSFTDERKEEIFNAMLSVIRGQKFIDEVL